jgi:hypothetical protein
MSTAIFLLPPPIFTAWMRQLFVFFTFLSWHNSPFGAGPHHWCFTIKCRHTTFDRTTLDKWSDQHRERYSQETGILVLRVVRNRNSNKRAAVDPPLRKHCPWELGNLTSENDWSATGFAIEDVNMCRKRKTFVLEKWQFIHSAVLLLKLFVRNRSNRIILI